MTVVNVPIFNDVYNNTEGAILNDKNYKLINAIQGELGETRSRPCLTNKTQLATSTGRLVTGTYYWPHKDIFLFTTFDKVYKGTIGVSSVTPSDLTTTAITPGIPTTFATDGAVCIIASGGNMVFTDGTTKTAALAPTGAPTAVSSIAFIEGYFVANSVGTNTFYWCDTNDYTNWQTGNSGYASAVADADSIVALKSFNRELFVFGQISLERWETTGDVDSIFQRISGGVSNYGCIAPASVVATDNFLVWLDHKRRFVMWADGGCKLLPTPYDKEINQFTTVSDCVGFPISVLGQELVVFSFPSEDKTLVFNCALNKWSEWSNWEDSEYTHWFGYTYAQRPSTGLHIVGSSRDNCFYTLSTTGFEDDSQTIRGCRITGHIDYGTSSKKRSNSLTLRCNRGEHNLDREAFLMLRWNDDNKGWSNEIKVSLGKSGDRKIIQRVFPRGLYETRQYEIAWSDPIDVVFADAKEDITVLR